MTEPEVRAWLGYGPEADGRSLRPEVIAGMKDVPVPHVLPQEHIAAFRAWLECEPGPGRGVFAEAGPS